MNAYVALLLELAHAATDARDFARAEVLLKLIGGLNGVEAHVLYLLGHVQIEMERYHEAAAALSAAVAIEPERAAAHNDLAVALYAIERDHEARMHILRALEIRPDFPEAMVTNATTLLRSGNFRAGWVQYETRARALGGLHLARNFSEPRWQGEDIAGRTILLHAEQGIGDLLQFVRYVPLVAACGATVLLEVHPDLIAVLHGLRGTTAIVPCGEALPPFDVHCPLLSLPFVFATDIASIPADVPYLAPLRDRVARWRERLGPHDGMRIGLVVAGNPDNPNDRHRSISLARFARVIRSARGCSFHLLDKSVAPPELLANLPTLHTHSTDMADAAAMVSLMDLVITVDTAMAHLAGALGWPVWTLLPHRADWRWLEEREDSPWYPTMRLFRQSRSNDWDGVLDRVAQSLADVLT